MKQTANLVKIIAFTIVSLVAAIVFWPFAIGGIVALIVSRIIYNRWVSSAFALLIAVVWRLSLGEWKLRFGDGSLNSWYLETFHGIVNWALAAIFVSAFAHWTAMIIEGYKSAWTRTA